MSCGIYCIECVPTKKKYYGSTNNFSTRFRNHKVALNKNTHYNEYLQNAWNKYGCREFKFYTVENVDEEELLSKESFYIERDMTWKRSLGFNIIRDPARGNHSQETKDKLSEIRKGIKNPFYGKSHSENHKRMLSEQNSGDKNPFHGRKHSSETRLKISKNHSRRKLSDSNILEIKKMNEGRNIVG